MSESASSEHRCPQCGRSATTQEEQSEFASLRGWVCPECGFTIDAPSTSAF